MFYLIKLRASVYLLTLISHVTPPWYLKSQVHSPWPVEKERRESMEGRKEEREGWKEKGWEGAGEEEDKKWISTSWSRTPIVQKMVQNRTCLLSYRATQSKPRWVSGSPVFPWPCLHSLFSSSFPSPSLCFVLLVLPVAKPWTPSLILYHQLWSFSVQLPRADLQQSSFSSPRHWAPVCCPSTAHPWGQQEGWWGAGNNHESE